MSTLKTWIVVPTGNGLRWLPECLQSLSASLDASTRVCIVDNASQDGSVEYVRRSFPNAFLMPLAMNLGFVQATNLGLLEGWRQGSESFVLLNNDTRARPGWLDAIRRASERGPDFGILGSWQTDFQGNASPRSTVIQRSSNLDPMHDGTLLETDWVEGSCLWFRRAVLDAVGYLDPLFAPAYFEEIDFCRRARRNGFRVGLVLDSVIEHHGAGSSLAQAGRRRQRVLNERNYLIYHAVDPQSGSEWRRLSGLAARTARHGWKSAASGRISPSELAEALIGLPRRWQGIRAKIQRDRRNCPCPILGNRSLSTPEQRYYAECVDRISDRRVLSKSNPRFSVALPRSGPPTLLRRATSTRESFKDDAFPQCGSSSPRPGG